MNNPENKVEIFVASHKEYRMPEDKMYIPLFVGAQITQSSVPQNFVKDNTGDNISALNPYFCELTGLYWAWKNADADYLGLAHYRRHFSLKRKAGFDNILKSTEIEPYLGKVKIFTPSKRKYYIETLYSHYSHTFSSQHLDAAEKIIAEKYPSYSCAYKKAVSKRSGYMFNMMIMRKDLLSDYCSWLFDILFELKKRIDDTNMSAFEKRYCGRVSEILFNVWLTQKLESNELCRNDIKEIPFVNMEKTDWAKKGSSFLKAKFFGKKYEKSF